MVAATSDLNDRLGANDWRVEMKRRYFIFIGFGLAVLVPRSLYNWLTDKTRFGGIVECS